MSKETNETLGHADESDGIEEYDNPLPDWWLGLFGVTIVWAFAYAVSYHFIEGDSQEKRYEVQMAEAAARWPVSDEIIAFEMSDELVAEGAGVFAQNCASCHNDDMTGKIGPSLIDAEWIHGSEPEAVVYTITNGVLAKAMPAWGTILGPEKVQAVAAYIIANRDPNVVDLPSAVAPVAEQEAAIDGDGTIDEDITQDGVVVVIDEEPAVPAALDPSITGESIFLQNCVACHGADMTGGVGPNLIDDEWIHGGDLPTITRIITEGVPEKGMISWGPILGEQKIELVAQYVHSKTAE